MPGPQGYEAGAQAEAVVVPLVSTQLPRVTVDAARAGDVAAFEAIVRHYDGRLRALAHRLLGDAAAMDDAMQEAYVKAFRALPGFSGRASLSTWLYRITYNACIDELRHAEKAPLAEIPGWETASADDTEEEALRHVSVQAALASLPVEHRAVVLLVDGEGLSYREAAEVLGCRSGTVASRLSRARDSLRAALSDVRPSEVRR